MVTIEEPRTSATPWAPIETTSALGTLLGRRSELQYSLHWPTGL